MYVIKYLWRRHKKIHTKAIKMKYFILAVNERLHSKGISMTSNITYM